MRVSNFNTRANGAGFTLIEVMIVVALVAVVIGVAGPSFSDYIKMQRLRGVHSQLLTDLNLTRSEAVSRGVPVQLRFQTSTDQTCYVIYSRPANDMGTTSPCDCTAAEGARCPGTSLELKTVSVPTALGVALWQGASQTPYLTINPRSGAPDTSSSAERSAPPEYALEVRSADASRRLKLSMSSGGRVQACSPAGTVAGMTAC